jgi:Fe-S cluster assembly protein SufD
MHYAEHYHDHAVSLPGQALPWLKTLRKSAEIQFATQGFPSMREEEWCYTNLAALAKTLYTPSPASGSTRDIAALVERYRLADSLVMVFIDGRFCAEHSQLSELPAGVELLSLAVALTACPTKIEPLLHQTASSEEHGLIAFTTAYFSDGLFLHVPEAIIVERPIQLLSIGSRSEGLAALRNIIALDRHAQASVVETWTGADSANYLTTSITEIKLAENARLDHYKLQLESSKSQHFGGIYAHQASHSRLHQQHAAFGGLMARTEIHSTLGTSAECDLDGLFLASGRRHLDTHTRVRHAEAHASSRENYRGIASDRGRGVFSGRIIVGKAAQKTDAAMSCRNLLLSADAEIDSKPQLEIHADDVKCAHGVTVGQLDAGAVFYLESRGIDEASARNMLTFAFANEMVGNIRIPGLKTQVQEALLAHLPQADIRGEWL